MQYPYSFDRIPSIIPVSPILSTSSVTFGWLLIGLKILKMASLVLKEMFEKISILP